MNRTILTLYVLLFLGIGPVFAQEEDSKMIKLHALAQGQFMISVGEDNTFFEPGVTGGAGILIDDFFAVSAITGMRFLPISTAESTYQYPIIPLLVDARFYFLKKKLSPILYLQGGYGVTTATSLPAEYPLYNYIWGGLNVGAGTGFAYRFNSKVGIHLGLGYTFQQIHFADPQIAAHSHLIGIDLGVNFR